MVSPVEIFCCYAREDQRLLNELKAHLMPLQRQGLIKIWADTDIGAGTEWEKEIEKHLDTAQIILLLVSSDFINSNYCYSREMKRAIERHEQGEVRVIPIILRHVYWQGLLGNFQALPKDALPITDPDWHNLDRALFNVTEGIRKVVEELVISAQVNLVISTAFANQKTTNDHHQHDLYNQYWSRKYPGLVIILLDQHGSMHVRGEQNSASLVDRSTMIANRLIISIMERVGFDEITALRKKICDLLVLGYGDTVYPLLGSVGSPISIAEVANNLKGMHRVRRHTIDPVTHEIKVVDEKQPYWIEPQAFSYDGKIVEALRQACEVIQNWLQAVPQRHLSFPPIVINITGLGYIGMDVMEEAKRLTELETKYGRVLFFNGHLSPYKHSIKFPNDTQELYLAGVSPYEASGIERLFKTSSKIPPSMIKRALSFNYQLKPDAHGFISNADSDVLHFINFLPQDK